MATARAYRRRSECEDHAHYAVTGPDGSERQIFDPNYGKYRQYHRTFARAFSVNPWTSEEMYDSRRAREELGYKHSTWTWRCIMRQRYGHVVTCPGFVQDLVNFAPPAGYVEIGAGCGYVAWLLRQAGVDVVAYDRRPARYFGTGEPRGPYEAEWVYKRHSCLWAPVNIGDAEDARRHPDRALLLCWPPHWNTMATRALLAHAHAGGTDVAYAGDWYACGRPGSREMLQLDYTEIDDWALPSHDGCRDHLYLYRRSA